jgi:hypothetical protein
MLKAGMQFSGASSAPSTLVQVLTPTSTEGDLLFFTVPSGLRWLNVVVTPTSPTFTGTAQIDLLGLTTNTVYAAATVTFSDGEMQEPLYIPVLPEFDTEYQFSLAGTTGTVYVSASTTSPAIIAESGDQPLSVDATQVAPFESTPFSIVITTPGTATALGAPPAGTCWEVGTISVDNVATTAQDIAVLANGAICFQAPLQSTINGALAVVSPVTLDVKGLRTTGVLSIEYLNGSGALRFSGWATPIPLAPLV